MNHNTLNNNTAENLMRSANEPMIKVQVMAVPMQLSRIIISEISDNQVIYLQEIEGTRQFPILIGIFEATSIDRRIKTDFKPFWVKRRYLGWAIKLLMRRRRGYRLIDRLLILHVLSMIYRVIALRKPHWIPGFAKESAMGVDVVFK